MTKVHRDILRYDFTFIIIRSQKNHYALDVGSTELRFFTTQPTAWRNLISRHQNGVALYRLLPSLIRSLDVTKILMQLALKNT